MGWKLRKSWILKKIFGLQLQTGEQYPLIALLNPLYAFPRRTKSNVEDAIPRGDIDMCCSRYNSSIIPIRVGMVPHEETFQVRPVENLSWMSVCKERTKADVNLGSS